MEGVKFDEGKLEFSLMPIRPLKEVMKVLQFGKNKYEADNWKKVPNAVDRYKDAAFRHLVLGYMDGEVYDKESKLHHLAHCICCCLFIMWFDFMGAVAKNLTTVKYKEDNPPCQTC